MAIINGQLGDQDLATIVSVAAGANPIRITNEWWYNTDSSSAIGIDLHIVKSGQSASVTNQIADTVGTELAANSTIELDIKNLILGPGDSIQALAGTASKISYTIATESV